MSPDALLAGLCLVVILSVLARLFGDLVSIPVIVPLLAIGVVAGISVAGVIEPDKLIGDSLSPFVQIVVALILFDGAMGLKLSKLPSDARPAVLRLITLGVLVTWGLGSVGAILILGLPTPIAILVGAILIVSGPTVVLPLLNFARPPDRVRATLKWEGVIMDPIGALVAVAVFAALTSKEGSTVLSLEQFGLSAVVGITSGLLFSVLLMVILANHRFSGRDKVAATLAMVIASFLAADLVYQDAGLAAALVMGIVLANQSRVNTTYITEFKEALIPILLGILFVLLAANIDIGDVIALGLPGLAFVAFLSFLVRPLAVMTTVGLPITWKERLVMMSISARGIVAAATAPIYGLALVDAKVAGADEIVPVVFLVIAGTVIISSILLPFMSKRLGMLGSSDPSMLMIGTPDWAISLAKTLKDAGTDVRFWTIDDKEAEKVKGAGLPVSTDPMDPRDPEKITGLNGVSLIGIASKHDALNQLMGYDLSQVMEPDQVYRVPGDEDEPRIVDNASRVIEAEIPLDEIEKRVEGGDRFVVFDSDDDLPDGAVPLLVIETTRTLKRPELYFHCDRPKSPRKRTRRIAALVPAGQAPEASPA